MINFQIQNNSLLGLLNEARSECYRADELEEFWIKGQIERITAETKRFVVQYSNVCK